MANKKIFFKNFWEKEWFSFSLVLLILVSSYAFYQSFPSKINLLSNNLFIPAYFVAFLWPFIALLVYLYFLLFFKLKISTNDYYRLRDISITFLVMIHFSFSLYAVSYPINLDFWLFLFFGFYIIYLSSLILKYWANNILAKFIAFSGLMFAFLSILPNYFRLPVIIIIICTFLSLLLYKRYKD